MTKLQTIVIAILSAALAGALYKFVPTMQDLAGLFASLALVLVGSVIRHPADKAAIEEALYMTPPVQPPVEPVRKPDGGHVRLGLAVGIALIGVLALVLACGVAKADTGPQFGGCIIPTLCLGPSATVTVGQFDFSTSKFSGGIMPGLGYGATYAPTQWYATGAALYLSFLVGQGQPNQATPSLMLSFANYLRAGVGVAMVEQEAGPVKTAWRLLFGLGSDFGGSPSYVKAAAVKGTP
jgi:hypothetical protein